MSDPNDILALEEAKLVEKLGPSWRSEIPAIREYAEKKLGLSTDEVGAIYDHRAVLALHEGAKAAQAKEREAAAAEKQERVEREHAAADKAKAMQPCTARDVGRYFNRFLTSKGRK